MRIAILGNSVETLIKFRTGLIKDLVSMEHTVWAFVPGYDDITKCKVKKIGAIPVDYRLNRSGINFFFEAIHLIKLSIKLKRINPDLVFCYFTKPVVFGAMAAYLSGVKNKIGMLEGLGYVFTDLPRGIKLKQYLIRKILVFLYKISLPILDRLILLNEDDYSDLILTHRIKVKKISILGAIGLDLMEYMYSKPVIDKISFLFVGRLLAEKGVYEFFAAAKEVKSRYPATKFVMLGSLDKNNPGGLSQEELSCFVESGIVEYPGYVDDVAGWMSSCSVFVLPSYREGFPRSIQEAMAIGRPVITTNVPGCRETVENGVNGFLIPPWSPQALAEKMIYFIENPDRITEMGLKSYEIAKERFDEKK